MLNSPSWADALHAAQTPAEKAKVLLSRAQQRQSKRLIVEDIEHALSLVDDSPVDLQRLLYCSDLPYSQMGLHTLARYIMADIGSAE